MQNLKLYHAVLDELSKRLAQDCAMPVATAKKLIETMGIRLDSEMLMQIVTIVDNFLDADES